MSSTDEISVLGMDRHGDDPQMMRTWRDERQHKSGKDDTDHSRRLLSLFRTNSASSVPRVIQVNVDKVLSDEEDTARSKSSRSLDPGASNRSCRSLGSSKEKSTTTMTSQETTSTRDPSSPRPSLQRNSYSTSLGHVKSSMARGGSNKSLRSETSARNRTTVLPNTRQSRSCRQLKDKEDTRKPDQSNEKESRPRSPIPELSKTSSSPLPSPSSADDKCKKPHDKSSGRHSKSTSKSKGKYLDGLFGTSHHDTKSPLNTTKRTHKNKQQRGGASYRNKLFESFASSSTHSLPAMMSSSVRCQASKVGCHK
jgi:hypothetical protein